MVKSSREYATGELVLALDNGTLYPAKILRIQSVGGASKYFIHYQMWPRKYDVWIDGHNICKDSEEKKKQEILSRSTVSATAAVIGDKQQGKRKKGEKKNDSAAGFSAEMTTDDRKKKIIVAIPKGGKLVLKEEDPPEHPQPVPAVNDTSSTVDVQNSDEVVNNNSSVNGRGRGRRKRSIEAVATTPLDAASPAAEPEEVSTKSVTKRARVSWKGHSEFGGVDKLKLYRKLLSQQDLVDEDDEKFVEKLPIPNSLKKFLADEWYLVTNSVEEKRLLQLPKPSHLTLDALVAEFIQQKKTRLTDNTAMFNIYRHMFHGLLTNFNKALPTILLYRQERDQYEKLKEKYPTAEPSQLYGMEHILRFFVRMPKLLSNVFMAANDFHNILSKLVEFMKFAANPKIKMKYVDMAAYETYDEVFQFLSTASNDLKLIQSNHYQYYNGADLSNDNVMKKTNTKKGMKKKVTEDGRKKKNVAVTEEDMMPADDFDEDD